jgi:hypothetical protein
MFDCFTVKIIDHLNICCHLGLVSGKKQMKNALRHRSGSTMNFTVLFYDQILGEPFFQLHTNNPMKEPIKYCLLQIQKLYAHNRAARELGK